MRALVITSQPVVASETFIGAHVEALSYRKTYLIGYWGFYRLPNEPVGHNPLWKQIARRLPVINKRFKAYGFLRHYFKTNKKESVIAEYVLLKWICLVPNEFNHIWMIHVGILKM